MSKLTSVLRDHGVGAISGSSNAPYFGTGADGDLIITAPTLTAAKTSAPIGGDVTTLYDGDDNTAFLTNTINSPTPIVIQVDLGTTQWVCNAWFSGWTWSTGADHVVNAGQYAIKTSTDGVNWDMRKAGFENVDGGNDLLLPARVLPPKEYVAKFLPVQARYVAFVYNVTGYNSKAHIINSFRIGSGRFISVPIEDVTTVVKNYENLSIGTDCTLTVDKRCRGLIVYARGNISIAGTIEMSGKAAYVDTTNLPQIILPVAMRRVMQFDPLNNKMIAIPKGGPGGTGGNGGTAGGGLGGWGCFGGAGTHYGGGVGGGGGGGGARYQNNYAMGGAGGIGSSGPGGLGGASITASTTSKVNGNPGGIGAGGSGGASRYSGAGWATGGAGGSGINGGGGGGAGGASSGIDGPYMGSLAGTNGENRGGGALIVVCRGDFNLQATGSILANAVGLAGKGSDGNGKGTGGVGGGGGGGGGGAGGGTVTIIYKGTYNNTGSIQVNGTLGALGGLPNTSSDGAGQTGISGGIGSVAVYNLNTL